MLVSGARGSDHQNVDPVLGMYRGWQAEASGLEVFSVWCPGSPARPTQEELFLPVAGCALVPCGGSRANPGTGYPSHIPPLSWEAVLLFSRDNKGVFHWFPLTGALMMGGENSFIIHALCPTWPPPRVQGRPEDKQQVTECAEATWPPSFRLAGPG